MAHKLTGQNLEYVALNMEDCKKDLLYKRRMVVRVCSGNALSKMKSILEQAYNPEKTLIGPDCSVVLAFTFVWQRDEAVNDVNAAVDEYMSATYNTNPPASPDTPDTPEKPEKDDTEDKPDYTTYIIIGVLAAIIIALLWRRR